MSEFNRLTELVAAEMVQERGATPRTPRPRAPRRTRHTRHTVARTLYALADRLDA